MKTHFSTLRVSVYSTLGLFSILLTSCGSSQSTTYNDRDGIYGATANSNAPRQASQGTQYKEYFGSLQQSNEPDQIFTDVENYRSDSYDNAQNPNTGYDSSYGGWGSNPDNVTVNIYDNSWGGWGWNNYWYSGYWGWNLGWGWNSWYGPAYYGWGFSPYPYYAYGYGGWQYYYPYGYGYAPYYNGYAYSNGRRSSGYRNVISTGGRSNAYYNTPRGSRNSSPTNATRTPSGTRYSTYNTPRSGNIRTTPSNSNTREYNTAPRGNVRTQPQNSAPRNNSSVRNYGNQAPRNNNYTPSSAPSRSSGGGGGNYSGGGRSGGGGRR